MQLIVLGMHRSGTSMLMRLLNLMGAYFGPEGVTTGANAENPRGFWERRDVRNLNDALLGSLGCDWNRISSLDIEKKLSPQALSTFRKKAGRLVLEMDGHRPWALKEPRLCLLLPFWLELLEVPVLVHIHRHPAEVASSLEKRNGVPHAIGLALWERYVVAAHRNVPDIPGIRISHRHLIDDPVGAVRFLFEALSALSVQGLRLPADREITSFVSQDLYRERASRTDLQTLSEMSQIRLFEMLEAGEPSASIAAWAPDPASADALAAYEATLPPLPKESAAAAAPTTAEQVKRLDADVEFLRNITTKFASDLKDRDEGLRGLEWEVRTIRGDLKQHGSELAGRDRRNAELQEQLGAKDALVRLREAELRERDARVRTLEDELREAGIATKQLAEEIAQRDRRIAEQQEAIAAKSALKAEYKALAEQRDQLVRSLEASIRAAGEEAIQRAQDIAQRDHRIGELQQQLSALDLHLQRREEDTTRLQNLTGALQTSLDRARTESAAREELVSRQDHELLAARASIDGHERAALGYRADVERLSREVKELEAVRTAAESKVTERFGETEQLTRMLMEKEDEVRKLLQDLLSLKASIEQRDGRIAVLEPLQGERDALTHECRQLGERVKWLRDRLRSLETSTSWKVTAPFRSFMSVLRGGLRDGGASKSDLELIRSSALFDAAWYVSTYPDVGESGQEPAEHYLLHGGFEGRNPGPGFDSRRYFSLHRDVAKSGMNPLLHYVRYGSSEGRSLGAAAAITQLMKNG